MDKFNPGDLVMISNSTHEPAIPEHRVGMIIEEDQHYEGEVYTVLFLGSDTRMRFHRMFLTLFTTR